MSGRGFRPLWLVALLLGGGTLWLVSDLHRQLDNWRESAVAERRTAEQRLSEAVAEAVGRADREHADAQTELQSRLDSQRGQLESVTAERDRALADLAESSATADALNERVVQLESGHEQLEQELAVNEDQRLRQAGESARLLDQVLDRDRRLDTLNQSLAELREQGVIAGRPAAVVTIERADGPATKISEALRRSGAAHAVVLEGAADEAGTLHGVLARLTEDGQPVRLIAAQRAMLTFVEGRASLRLEGLAGDIGDAQDALEIDLPAFDAEAWVAAGLAVRADFRSAGTMSIALSGLLERFGWQLDGLHGADGATLLGVELSQRDAAGQVLRSLRAPRAALTAGSELTLWDGTVTVNGDERGFFDGIFRLPLPGLDAAAWDAALGLGTP